MRQIQIGLVRSHFELLCFAGFEKSVGEDDIYAGNGQFRTVYDRGGNTHHPAVVVSAIIFLSGYCSGQIWILISPWGGQEGSDAYYRVNGFDAEVFSPQDILASALDCHEGPDSEKAKKNSSQVPAVFAGPLQRAVKAVKASFGQGSDFFGR